MEGFLLFGPTRLEAAHGQRQRLHNGFLPTPELGISYGTVPESQLWRSGLRFR